MSAPTVVRSINIKGRTLNVYAPSVGDPNGDRSLRWEGDEWLCEWASQPEVIKLLCETLFGTDAPSKPPGGFPEGQEILCWVDDAGWFPIFVNSEGLIVLWYDNDLEFHCRTLEGFIRTLESEGLLEPD